MITTKLMRVAVTALLAALTLPVPSAAQHTRYKLIDVGTLGGPNSYFSFIGASSLTNHTVVTGSADTATPVSSQFCFIDCFLAHTFLRRDGVLTDLGGLPGVGVSQSAPNDINAKGVVAGVAFSGGIDPVIGFPAFHAVVWKNGQTIDLGTFGGTFSYANAINDQDQVAGFGLNTTPDSFDLGDLCENFPMPTQMRAFIWQNGVKQDLGTLGGTDSCALKVNQRGQAAGHSFTNSIVNPATGLPTVDPFLWDHGTMLDLGSLGGTLGVANWLNNRSQVVGQSNMPGDSSTHPFLWERGSLKDLGSLGGTFGLATSISDSGDIVGGATNQNDQAFLAFGWKNGVMTTLGTVDGDDCSLATSVNSGGQAVGFSFPCAGGPSHAFLWERGSIIDLNTFVPPDSDLQLMEATFINDRREIAVQAVLPNGDNHAVLLVPADQDETDAGGATVGTQSSPVRVAPATASRTAAQSSLTPKEMIAALRVRFGKRYHIPAFGAPRN